MYLGVGSSPGGCGGVLGVEGINCRSAMSPVMLVFWLVPPVLPWQLFGDEL